MKRTRATGKLRIETVPSDDGITIPLERFLAAIDEETLLVPFSHVLVQERFPAERESDHRTRA